MDKISLTGSWRGICKNGNTSFPFFANVPGSSIKDLMDNEYLPKEIFYGKNSLSVLSYEKSDFVYSKEFNVKIAENRLYKLHFERLDTYAKIYLNDILIAETQDAHISYDFDITKHILDGRNELSVVFDSPVSKVNGLPLLDACFSKERLYTRRTQCSYGWDWVDRFISCGINGDVYISVSDHDEVDLSNNVYVYTKYLDDEFAEICVDVNIDFEYKGRVVKFEIISPKGEVVNCCEKFIDTSKTKINFSIYKPQLWFPIGYGEQPLYNLRISDYSGIVFNDFFGIRMISVMELVDEKDGEYADKAIKYKNAQYDFNDLSSGLIIKVNGIKIFCKGANWVPTNPFILGDEKERIINTLHIARDYGVNMIRVWGGGSFESKDFYKECSRLGIMVTQDFLMACGYYPENDGNLLKEFGKEAEYITRLIRNEPCLVWWTGDNEGSVLNKPTDNYYHGKNIIDGVIFPIVLKNDYTRTMYQSSPFGGNLFASNTVGSVHNTYFLMDIFKYIIDTDCSDYKDEYKKYIGRFVNEEAQMGACFKSSLQKFMPEDDIETFDRYNEMWAFHTKDNPAIKTKLLDYLTTFAEKVLGEATDGKDLLFKRQYIQYEWVRLLLEQARREKWFCSGEIFWMLNDCWPASVSWALIDYYLKPKPALYAFKKCSKQDMISLDKEENDHFVYIVNDTYNDATYNVKIYIMNFETNKIVQFQTINKVVLKWGKEKISINSPKLQDNQIIVADLYKNDICIDRTFYKCGALKTKPSTIEYSIDYDNSVIKLHSATYLQSVRIDGNIIAEDNMFTMLPNEIKTIAYSVSDGKKANIEIDAFTLQN